MDLSVVLFTSDRGITPAAAAKAAEDAGFHSFYVPEHSHIPTSRDSAHPGTGGEIPDDRYLRILDPWVALATAAAVTSTIRLGTAVALPRAGRRGRERAGTRAWAQHAWLVQCCDWVPSTSRTPAWS
jgi:hypothetical protein